MFCCCWWWWLNCWCRSLLGDVAPHVKVIGVEYEESACLKAALEANERVVLPHVGLFADGTAVAQIGAFTF